MALPEMPEAAFRFLSRSLKGAGIETADLEARRILEYRAQISWADIITQSAKALTSAQKQQIKQDLERRISGEPLSRIYGERQFWGMDFLLSPATLDPRPETELIVEKALKAFANKPPAAILDLGTGTGCLLIALLTEFTGAQGFAMDKSSEALNIARRNAIRHDVAARACFYCGDWAGALAGSFDLVVSNPPYIRNQDIPNLMTEVRNHDPILSLDGGADGLEAYKKIFTETKTLLKPGAKSFFEIGKNQSADVVRLAEESGFTVTDVHADLAGLPRVMEISCGDK